MTTIRVVVRTRKLAWADGAGIFRPPIQVFLFYVGLKMTGIDLPMATNIALMRLDVEVNSGHMPAQARPAQKFATDVARHACRCWFLGIH